MSNDTILTDSNARQYVMRDGAYVRIDNHAEDFTGPRVRPQDIPQPLHYRILDALLSLACKARW
jgi:hypothetical protein